MKKAKPKNTKKKVIKRSRGSARNALEAFDRSMGG